MGVRKSFLPSKLRAHTERGLACEASPSGSPRLQPDWLLLVFTESGGRQELLELFLALEKGGLMSGGKSALKFSRPRGPCRSALSGIPLRGGLNRSGGRRDVPSGLRAEPSFRHRRLQKRQLFGTDPIPCGANKKR